VLRHRRPPACVLDAEKYPTSSLYTASTQGRKSSCPLRPQIPCSLTALGIKAVEQGYKIQFTSAQALIASLARANIENRLEERLKLYCQAKLLIVDEIGYIPIDRHGANLFFQLISRRYEKGAMILTSNQPFSGWGEVFGDTIIATAILDRILHHSITINIKGESYRLKEKLKAGIVQRQEPKD